MTVLPNVLLFDASKSEAHTPTSGFKKLVRKLKTNWKVEINQKEISDETLSKCKLFVIPGPQEKFSAEEIDALHSFVRNGGGILVLLCEGGERRSGTNINYFLEEYGISVNSDSVVRTQYYKHLHPKECFISDGVLNRSLCMRDKSGSNPVSGTEVVDQTLAFVFAFGASLNVSPPAIALLSTGSVSLPSNRPVCAMFEHGESTGRILVLGSTDMLTDSYTDREQNEQVRDIVFDLVFQHGEQRSQTRSLNRVDAANPEVSDYHLIPSVPALAERVRTCLQESESGGAADNAAVASGAAGPGSARLFGVDWRLVNDTLAAYTHTGVQHQPLRLIVPQFEVPLPALQPATFPAVFREARPPPLELFDLDAEFSSDAARLARLTNSCGEHQLEYYIRQCAEIVGVAQQLPPTARSARHVLEYMLVHLVEYKKVNQQFELMHGGQRGTDYSS